MNIGLNTFNSYIMLKYHVLCYLNYFALYDTFQTCTLICRLDQLAKERMAHERMEHPASRKQLEDVWEKQDGLADADFDPKTFFFLHGNYMIVFSLLLK